MLKSWKSNECHAALEYLINEIDPHQDTSRAGKVNRAIIQARNLSDDDWNRLMKQLKAFKKKELPIDILVPTAMQVKIEERLENDLAIIEEKIKRALDLQTLQTQYEMQLLWFHYLGYLKNETMSVGDAKMDLDLTGPAMVEKLVQILLLNRASDKQTIESIKQILISWEE